MFTIIIEEETGTAKFAPFNSKSDYLFFPSYKERLMIYDLLSEMDSMTQAECEEWKLEREREYSENEEVKINSDEFVYLVRSRYGVKIGRTKRPEQRFSAIKCYVPDAELIGMFKVDDSVKKELSLHSEYEDKRKSREWFDLSECDITNIVEGMKL